MRNKFEDEIKKKESNLIVYQTFELIYSIFILLHSILLL